MSWADVLKAAVKNGLSHTGYTINNIKSSEEHWIFNVECITRLFSKAEQLVLLPDNKRSKLLASLTATSIVSALSILKHLSAAMTVEGDICEFGVAHGATSALLANEMRSTNKHIWLFDSFAGLPEPTEKDDITRDFIGAMCFPRSIVEKRLREIGFPQDRIHIVAGFFPESAQRNSPDSVCFAYIDFDLYCPIRDALEFVDRRMRRGGTIVVDNYGDPVFRGARKAVDDFILNGGFTISISEYDRIAILSKR